MSLSRELLERELAVQNSKSSSDSIPSSEDVKHDQQLISNYRNFIRFSLIKAKKNNILDNFMLDMVGKHLCESQMLSYDSFRIISSSAPEKAKAHFSAKRFLLFPRDKHLEIESEKFIRYVERAVEIEKTILNLMEFSISDDPSSTTISSQNLEVAHPVLSI